MVSFTSNSTTKLPWKKRDGDGRPLSLRSSPLRCTSDTASQRLIGLLSLSYSNAPDPDSVDPDRLCEIIAGPVASVPEIPGTEEILESYKLTWEEAVRVAPAEIRSATEKVLELMNDLYDQSKSVGFDPIRARDETPLAATLDRIAVQLEALDRWFADNCTP